MLEKMKKKGKDLISVLVPVHNNGDYLEDCIRSLLEQTYPKFEVIIIDDGSTDHSWSVCEKMQKEDGRIRAVHQTWKGVSSARNHAMELAEGEYFVFLDGDDMLHPQFLEVMLDRIRKTGADMTGCGFFRIPTEQVKRDIRQNFKGKILGGGGAACLPSRCGIAFLKAKTTV